MGVFDNTPVCIECAEQYGDPVRIGFPVEIGRCAICEKPGEVCRGRDYGGLPNLPREQRRALFKKELYCGS